MKLIPVLRKIGGTMLFMLGIISLALPVLPGWIFIGVGLYILSLDSPGITHRVDRLRARYKFFDEVMIRVDRLFGKKKDDTYNEKP